MTTEELEDMMIKDISLWASEFLDRRFEKGFDDINTKAILVEVVIDAFQAGALWAENQMPTPAIIKPNEV